MTPGPLDLVRTEIMRRLGPEIDARFEQLTPILVKALNRNQPLEEVDIPPATQPVSASTAAKRTAFQGIVTLVLAGVFGFAADTFSGGEFDLLDYGDWKGLGSGAVVAGFMALLAYGQRKLGR